MDIERVFISKVLVEKCMDKVLDEHVPEELFPEHLEIWQWLVEQFRAHGGTPPFEAVESKWPDFEICSAEGPISFFIQELKKKRVQALLVESIRKQADLLKAKDPEAALQEVRDVLHRADFETRPTKDVNLVADPESRLIEYKALQDADGCTGFPSPWPALDEATLGFHAEELILFAGRGGVGKTWCEVVLAWHHWKMGQSPLLFSREMAVGQIIRRLDAVDARLSYQRFRSGQLSHDEYARWKTALIDMKENAVDFWVTGDDTSGAGIDGIVAKILRYRPKIVYIDGLYLIADPRKGDPWKKLSDICWDLKLLARREGIPIIVTHQFALSGKDNKGTEDTMKYGDIQMWFDLVVGLYQGDDQRTNKEMLFKVLKQREGAKTEWVASWDLDNMVFDQKNGRDDLPPKPQVEVEDELRF